MKEKSKLFSIALAATALVLFLVLIPSTASAGPLTVTETQITTSGSAENPAIYGDRIVWVDGRNSGSDIYMYDLSTKKETRITKSGSAENPAIYEDRIVYQDNRNGNWGDIYMYDLSTKKETRITTSGYSYNPDIYNNKIVWDNGGIFLYDLSTKKVTLIAKDWSDNDSFAPSGSYYNNPVIYGNKIAWFGNEYVDINNLYVIYSYDLSTKKKTQIASNINPDLGFPKINNDKIVYDNWEYTESEGYKNNVHAYDLSTNTETKIATSGLASYPDIYRNRIVWQNSNIYMYDLSTNTETQITTCGLAQNPAIYGDRIVWGDGRSGKNDIYMASLSSSKSPVAAFSAFPLSGKVPLKVQFTDKSTGAPTKWSWTFGDGATSTKQNPLHKYSKAGSYTVKLTATNAEGSNTVTKTNYIKVIAKPVAAFSASPTSGKAPLNVAFTDKSTGLPAKWKWSFGDGKTSTVQNPKHQYVQEGKYKVTLTVSNNAGSSTATKTNYIIVATNTRPGIYSESK